jgi:vacuolar-type H+-ATPase subunit I/STV1
MKNWTNEMSGEDIVGSFIGGLVLAGILFGLAMTLVYAPLLAKLAIAFILSGGVFGTYAFYRANKV